MSLQFIVAVRDSKMPVYMRPFTVPHKGAAIRGFMDAVNTPSDEPIYKHYRDFDLCLLGTFDEDTGEIAPLLPSPVILAAGVDVRQEP